MTTARSGLATMLMTAAILALSTGSLQAQKRQRDRITRQEIMESAHRELDMYQVIRSLRPHFLQPPKGQRSLGAANYASVALYVDEKKELDMEALRTMSPSSVEEVRYLEPSASVARWGPNVNGGALMIKLYKPSIRRDSTSSP